jgi:N-succinyl-L-ornithine transcarbamylase
MNVIVLDVNQGAWKLETERGVVMESDKSEHLLEAIPVMGSYCDLIGVRSFARFESRKDDYEEKIMQQFIQYSGRPVFFMESATVHPLQAFADLITIEEYKNKTLVEPNPLFGGEAVRRTLNKRPKVVLSWAPHPKALPQAVPNSFAQWMLAAANPHTGIEGGMDFVITHPKGYELDPLFVEGATVEYDQMRAFEGADFIYAKNWSCPGVTQPENYGKVLGDYHDYLDWTVGERQMAVTNHAFFMHCLPVRRNMIVTDDVIEAPTSIVIPEAANREISATVVLKRMLKAL